MRTPAPAAAAALLLLGAAGATQAWGDSRPARAICDEHGRCLDADAPAATDPYLGTVDPAGDVAVRAYGGYERDEPDGAPVPPRPPREFDGPFYRR